MGRASHLLRQIVYVAEPTGQRTLHGDPAFGTPRPVRCRYQAGKRLVESVTGGEIQADHVLCTERALALDARVWLPGRDTSDASQALRVLTVRSATTFDGEALFESYL